VRPHKDKQLKLAGQCETSTTYIFFVTKKHAFSGNYVQTNGHMSNARNMYNIKSVNVKQEKIIYY